VGQIITLATVTIIISLSTEACLSLNKFVILSGSEGSSSTTIAAVQGKEDASYLSMTKAL
jgi:hypothetical protein